jgi:hypothetical protein
MDPWYEDKQLGDTQWMKKMGQRGGKEWRSKFRDPDSVFDQLKMATNPQTATESARLADLFRIRVEGNMSAYRKVCNKCRLEINTERANNVDRPPPQTVLPEKAMSPSTDLLPESWLSASSAGLARARFAVHQ